MKEDLQELIDCARATMVKLEQRANTVGHSAELSRSAQEIDKLICFLIRQIGGVV